MSGPKYTTPDAGTEFYSPERTAKMLAREVEVRMPAKAPEPYVPPPPPPGIDAVLAQRGKTYGRFTELARISQKLKSMMQREPGWQRLADDQRECLEMVAHKIARILNGDPAYVDSWTDLAGYTTLVEKRLKGEVL